MPLLQKPDRQSRPILTHLLGW